MARLIKVYFSETFILSDFNCNNSKRVGFAAKKTVILNYTRSPT